MVENPATQELDRLADWLDSRYRIPGTRLTFGWDAILGLVPVAGDLLALGPAIYLVVRGYGLGARKRVLIRMGINTAIDFFIGSVPVLGSVFDLFFKANRRNIGLLKADLDRHAVPA